MSPLVYSGVKLLHILAMALWLGGPPVAVFRIRRSFASGPALAKATAERLLSITPVFIASALATIVLGALASALMALRR